MKKKTNWWAILAILAIGLPVGYVGTGVVKKLVNKDKEKVIITEPNPNPETFFLKINTNTLDFTSEKSSKTFDIESNTDWRILVDDDKDWLTVIPVEGHENGTVSLKVEENAEVSERTSTAVVVWKDNEGNDNEERLDVTQQGKLVPNPPLPPNPNPIPRSSYMSVTPGSISFGASGGTKNISVRSNTSWEVTGADSWLTANPLSGSSNKNVALKAGANTSTEMRTTSLTFSWKDDDGIAHSSRVNVTQSGVAPAPAATLSVSPSAVSFAANGGSKPISVRSNTQWSMTLTGGEGWLTTNTATGSNNKNVTLTATQNSTIDSRSATLRISWTDDQGTTRSKNINVSQAGGTPPPTSYLTVTSSDISFAANGGSKSLNVNSNTNWNVAVAGGEGWLSVNRTNGNGNKSITLKSIKNNTENVRTAMLRVTWTDTQGQTKSNTISVLQEKGVPAPVSNVLTKEQAQTIVSSGQTSSKIPDACTIVINGKNTKDYQSFRTGIRMKAYTNVRVDNVISDANGKVTRITVTATESNYED